MNCWQKHRDKFWLVDGTGRIVGIVEEIDIIGEDEHYGAAVYPLNQAAQKHVGRYVTQAAAKKAVEVWWAKKKELPAHD